MGGRPASYCPPDRRGGTPALIFARGAAAAGRRWRRWVGSGVRTARVRRCAGSRRRVALEEAGMKTLEETFHRGIGAELDYVCDRLKADEVEILGKALRRGLLEIYKAVVLHEMETGRIDRKEASRLLGSRVVERALAGQGVASHLRPQRPGPREMPRRRKER